MAPAKKTQSRTRPGFQSRSGRPTKTTRPTGRVSVRRRKPEPKGAEKFLSMLSGTAGKAGRVAPSSAKGKGGLALLGAGAVAALSQRDKLAGLFGKGGHDETPTPPSTPAAVEPEVERRI